MSVVTVKRNAEVKFHNVCNLFSSSLAKMCILLHNVSYTYTKRERERENKCGEIPTVIRLDDKYTGFHWTTLSTPL